MGRGFSLIGANSPAPETELANAHCAPKSSIAANKIDREMGLILRIML